MSFSVVHSRTLNGILAPQVDVEVHLANGLPSFAIVGLAETAIKESRDRVRSAIINSNFKFPTRKITVNLAPADLPKEGARFDLPIAIGILMASGQIRIDAEELSEYEFIGELALNGQLRSVAGVLPVAHEVRCCKRKLVIPRAAVAEAAFIKDLPLVFASTLNNLIDKLIQQKSQLCSPDNKFDLIKPGSYLDFSDIKGQKLAKRAIEIAAAGRHNLLMIGPPGCGKTMLASRLPGIMPPLTDQQAIETASIHSISSNGFSIKNWRRTPIRSPHHSCSPVALIGGGSKPIPGEVSLAHNGVLFLDELPEFDRRALEMLREPLETGYVNISRINYSQRYMANILLIAAANPCHCGYLGSSAKYCHCTPAMIQRYQSKLSGPLIDRFDMHIELAPLKPEELIGEYGDETSSIIAKRVNHARVRQLARQNKLNSELAPKELEQHFKHSSELVTYLGRISEKLNLTARSFYRVLRLGQTIADCEQCKTLGKKHINEALYYRVLDRERHS